MKLLMVKGAKVVTIWLAIISFEFLRCWMSPAMRCVKNSMGRRRTFHM